MHNDYHTPDDTANKIDFDGLVWVSRYAANIVWEVSNLSQKPTFKGVIGIGDNDFIDHDWKRQVHAYVLIMDYKKNIKMMLYVCQGCSYRKMGNNILNFIVTGKQIGRAHV